MVREKGHLTYEKNGVNCWYEIRDDYCVSEDKVEKILKEIAEIAYPCLLEQYKREQEEKESVAK